MSIQQGEPPYQDFWNYFEPPLPPPPPPKDNRYLPLIIIGAIIGLLAILSILGSMSNIVLQKGQTLSDLIAPLFFLALGGGMITLGIIIHNRHRKQHLPPPPPPILTDEGYEGWVMSKQGLLMEIGKQRLDLREDQIQGGVLVIRSLVFPDSEDARYYPPAPMRKKQGLDGHWHTSINRFLFLYPTKEYLAIFQSDVNALAPTAWKGGQAYFRKPLRYEGTSTYFYDDIVGIDTHSYLSDDIREDWQDAGTPSTAAWRQHLAIRISNGKSICATTRVRDNRVEQTVQLLRILLREKYHGQGRRETRLNSFR